jgi:hypothetical protein
VSEITSRRFIGFSPQHVYGHHQEVLREAEGCDQREETVSSSPDQFNKIHFAILFSDSTHEKPVETNKTKQNQALLVPAATRSPVLKTIESRRLFKFEISWVVQLLKHFFYILLKRASLGRVASQLNLIRTGLWSQSYDFGIYNNNASVVVG